MELEEPAHVRGLIKSWLRQVCETGALPFERGVGGTVVQLLNTWLRSYETEKIASFEERLKVLEGIKEETYGQHRRP